MKKILLLTCVALLVGPKMSVFAQSNPTGMDETPLHRQFVKCVYLAKNPDEISKCQAAYNAATSTQDARLTPSKYESISAADLKQVGGGSLYACYGIELQRVDGKPFRGVPITAPLKIVSLTAKYSGVPHFTRVDAVLEDSYGVKYKIPALVATTDFQSSNSLDAIENGLGLSTVMPHTLEVSISDDELMCAEGSPQSVNDYGDTSQLVYNDGHLIVYVDNETQRVTGIQQFGN